MQMALFSEIATVLVKLILVMPATNVFEWKVFQCLTEESIITLGLPQRKERMPDNLMLMSVYKEDADNLNLIVVACSRLRDSRVRWIEKAQTQK